MKTVQLDTDSEYRLKNQLPLILAQEDIDLTGKHYAVVLHKTTTSRGKDQHGRYKTVKTEAEFLQFKNQEEKEEILGNRAESIDDKYNMKIIESGKIPEHLQNREKAAALQL